MNTEQEKDKLLAELFRSASTSPSVGLRERIIQKLELKNEVFRYEPVIGKRAWILIGSGFCSLMAFLFAWGNQSALMDLEWQIPSPDFKINLHFTSDFFEGWSALSLPELPYAFHIASLALMVFGLYFIISMKFPGITMGRKK